MTQRFINWAVCFPVKLALLLLVIPRVIGTFVYAAVEDASLATAWYWSGQTQSTTGYGDVPPETFIGRNMAEIVWYTGIFGVALLTAAFAGAIAARKVKLAMESADTTDELDDDFDVCIGEINEALEKMQALKLRYMEKHMRETDV